MKLKVTTLLLFFTFSLHAAPTHEAFFRNSANPENIRSGMVLKLLITKEMPQEMLLSPIESSSAKIEEGMINSPTYVRLTLEKNKEELDLLQTLHETPAMSDSNVKSYVLKNKISKALTSDSSIDAAFFYSIIISQIFNDHQPVSALIRKHESLFLPNENLMDETKVAFFESYKRYLLAAKDNPSDETLVSPLLPTSPQDKEQLEMVMKGSIYKQSEGVTLIRKSGEFYWQLALPNIYALLGVENRLLSQVRLNTGEGEIEVHLEDYVSFGSISFPRLILFKDSKGTHFRVKVLELVPNNVKLHLLDRVKSIQSSRELDQKRLRPTFIY